MAALVGRKHVERVADLHIPALSKARAIGLDVVGSVTRSPPDTDRFASLALAVSDLARLDVLADFEAAADPAVDAAACGPTESGAFDFGSGDLAADVVAAVEWIGQLLVLVVLVDLRS